MNLRFRILRLVASLLRALSWPAALLGAVTAATSFRMPEIDQVLLYRCAVLAIRVGMIAIFVGIAFGFGMDWLARPFTGVNKVAYEALRRPRLINRAVMALLIGLALSAFVAMPQYVHPEAGKWISTGKHAPREVSADLARLFLWRQIRMDSLFVLVTVWNLGRFSSALLGGIKQVQTAGEELTPRIVTHIRPRDYRD